MLVVISKLDKRWPSRTNLNIIDTIGDNRCDDGQVHGIVTPQEITGVLSEDAEWGSQWTERLLSLQFLHGWSELWNGGSGEMAIRKISTTYLT
jgi:hypothetical protein